MPRRPLRPLVGAVLAAGLVLTGATGCSSLAGAETVSATRSWSVVGYAEAGSTPVSRLDADRAELTTVGVDGVNVTRDGSEVEPVSAAALQLLRQAHARHRSADLLSGNFDARLGDFSPAIGDALLGSTAHIGAVTSSLAREVRRHRWDGVTIAL